MTQAWDQCESDHPAWGRCWLVGGHVASGRGLGGIAHCAILDVAGGPVYQRWNDDGEDWPEIPSSAHVALLWAEHE
jgi:hypothetical protein